MPRLTLEHCHGCGCVSWWAIHRDEERLILEVRSISRRHNALKDLAGAMGCYPTKIKAAFVSESRSTLASIHSIAASSSSKPMLEARGVTDMGERFCILHPIVRIRMGGRRARAGRISPYPPMRLHQRVSPVWPRVEGINPCAVHAWVTSRQPSPREVPCEQPAFS